MIHFSHCENSKQNMKIRKTGFIISYGMTSVTETVIIKIFDWLFHLIKFSNYGNQTNAYNVVFRSKVSNNFIKENETTLNNI